MSRMKNKNPGIESEGDGPGLGQLVDHVLGEQSPEEREATQNTIATDVDAALECAELRTLFDDMRTLSVEPTGTVDLALRYAVDRRRRMRLDRAHRSESRWSRVAQVALVAAVILVSLVLVQHYTRPVGDLDQQQRLAEGFVEPVAPGSILQIPSRAGAGHGGSARASEVRRVREISALLAASNIPVAEASFRERLAVYDDLPLPESFAGWVSASEDLAMLREQYRLRFYPEQRRRMLASIGAPVLDPRVRRLAETLAARTRDDIRAGTATVASVSLALRGLLASGSSRSEGPYRDEVELCAVALVDRLTSINEPEAANALAALTDLAVIEGGRLVEIVGVYAEALARSTLTPRADRRPGLLNWTSSTHALADAGRVLQIAPAFGVHAGLAHRARMMIAAHLDERLGMKTETEHPTLLAAKLYGFEDLIDVEAVENGLRLWDSELLVPEYVALHHIAWSKQPSRFGWAEFQDDLRGLASVPTPGRTDEIAALLLSLASDTTAPSLIAADPIVL